ncbi:MAG TPA: serine hydrolase, partial [Thermoanaerobaculia bacterium]
LPDAGGELAARLDRLLAASYPAAEPGAAVLVERGGQVILRKGYGMANLELCVPVRPEMVFRIGSITKQLTAMAILRLAAEGKLALDDEVGKLLPGYPSHGRRITLENLLTHTSGIPNYTDFPAWKKIWRERHTPSEIIDSFKDEPLDFAPGERWRYDNSGYVLLGAILEKVTGRPYTDWMAETLLRPLGMTSTVVGDSAAVVPGRVTGYQGTPGHYVNAESLTSANPYADGAFLSTVDDVARWSRGLDAGALVRKDLLERMLTPYRLKDGRSTNYGYGWELWSYEGHRVEEHDGILNGFKAELLRMPDDRLLVVILSNNLDHQPSPAMLAIEIAAMAIGKPLAERKTVHLAPALLDRYAGTYRTEPDVVRVVSREGDRLFTQRAGFPKLEAFPAAENDFFYQGTMDRLRFVTNAAGNVTGLSLDRRYGGVELGVRTGGAVSAEGKGAGSG